MGGRSLPRRSAARGSASSADTPIRATRLNAFRIPYKTGLSLASDISCTPFCGKYSTEFPIPVQSSFPATPNVFFPPFDGGPYARRANYCSRLDLGTHCHCKYRRQCCVLLLSTLSGPVY